MGGGNGLKSHMSRERNQAKAAAEGKGGGGVSGIKARTESKVGVVCALCKTSFTSVKMLTQLRDHCSARHPKNAIEEAFPGVAL